MAGFIRLSDGKVWSSANWVYCGFLDYVAGQLPGDPVIVHKVQQAKWMQNLSFPLLRDDDPALAERVYAVVRAAAAEAAAGNVPCRVDGRVLDVASQQMFVDALKQLVQLIQEAE